jgi:hypothetical protein
MPPLVFPFVIFVIETPPAPPFDFVPIASGEEEILANLTAKFVLVVSSDGKFTAIATTRVSHPSLPYFRQGVQRHRAK